MTVVNTIKYRKIIRVGINFLAPIVLLIYLVTTFMNLSLINAELGMDVIRYRTATYSSIGITILITALYLVGRVYPKISIKRKVIYFMISLLMLADVIIWKNLGLVKIVMEDIGSISVDFTPIFMGLIIVLSLNLLIKGFDLFKGMKF